MEANNRIQTLFTKYLQNTISREELSEFWQLLPSQPNETLSTHLQNLWLQTEGTTAVMTDEEWNRKLKTLIEKAEKEDQQWKSFQERKLRRMPTWTKWVAAACILLVTGYVLWVTVGRRSQGTGDKAQVAKTNDVPAPKETRAVITLADGRKVYLDSVNNGTIAQENNVNIVRNKEGEILYMSPAGGGDLNESSNNKRPGVVFNTLSNPRGSKVISLTLSDGTKVWLNSESSLKYSIAFAGNTREVEITGEAYFEVKHNAQQPFKVHLPNGSIVEDIGTSFNINAYSDETDIRTTLIEGSVRVVGDAALNTNNGVILKPNQQSVQIPQTRVIRVQNNVDMNEVIAWKENKFYFDGADIKTIARQLSRWYDVDVEIKDNISNHFTGIISRSVNVSRVFEMLEQTGAVHFSVEGRKITVSK